METGAELIGPSPTFCYRLDRPRDDSNNVGHRHHRHQPSLNAEWVALAAAASNRFMSFCERMWCGTLFVGGDGGRRR